MSIVIVTEFNWIRSYHLQVHWLARHPEHEQAWLNVLAEEERYFLLMSMSTSWYPFHL